jgi:EmrB/QacA subfamily drug resistance transporter
VPHDASRLHPHHADEPPVDGTAPSGRARTIALAVLCLCALTTAVDITITNVALPFIGHELDATTSDLQWVIDSYNIVLAGLLVLGGGLADRYGRRTVFLVGYALFGVACAVAAFAPSAPALIGARALMGVGAAGVIAPALAIVATLYPPEERGRAIAAWTVFGAIGLAIGPVVGGFLLDHFWWGSVFLVNVPIVVLGVVVGIATIPQSRKPGTAPPDVAGALLSVLGLGALLFGVIEGPGRGWDAPLVLGALLAGVLLTAAFVRRELRSRAPLFDVRILARPVVAACAVTLFVGYVVFTGMLFLVPQYLQDVRGESIVTVGLLLVPFAAVFGLTSMRSATTVARVGARTTIAVGLGVCALGTLGLALAVDAAVGWTIAATALVGVGLSGLIAPPSTVLMNDLPEAKAGDGSSLSMVSRFTGAAVGVAVVGSVFASRYAGDLGDSVSSLSAAQASDATSSISGAVDVAAQVGGSAGTSLLTAARDAFDQAAAAGYVVLAVVAALAAGWAAWALRRVGAPGPPDPGDPAEVT